MQKTLFMLPLIFGIALANPQVFSAVPLVEQTQVNPPSSQEDLIGLDDQLFRKLDRPGDRNALVASINNSLRYLRTPKAQAAYQDYRVPGITRDRVRRSLVRFRQLLLSSKTPAELQAAVKREFAFYQSVGKDGQGTVIFTGYYQPIYRASRKPTAEYRYPLYRMPPNLANWSEPHPTRLELEGEDGLQGSKGKLRGLELFWLRDRMEAYFVQIEGSAQLQLTDGTVTTVGYAGKTNYRYTSLGRELANDGKVPLEGLTLPVILKYFQENPLELNNYIPRNQGFVFFRETKGAPAMGNLGVPVTPDRSIATDKSVMPPGALALIQAQIPYANATGQMEQRLVSRYVLDQDTGGAIKGAGRVDYYMGVGKVAGDRAAVTNGSGQLYYLLIKP
ncbi:MAG TPA: murein transglycosylase A [Candidatus Obscuribacterales bacterium]